MPPSVSTGCSNLEPLHLWWGDNTALDTRWGDGRSSKGCGLLVRIKCVWAIEANETLAQDVTEAKIIIRKLTFG